MLVKGWFDAEADVFQNAADGVADRIIRYKPETNLRNPDIHAERQCTSDQGRVAIADALRATKIGLVAKKPGSRPVLGSVAPPVQRMRMCIVRGSAP